MSAIYRFHANIFAAPDCDIVQLPVMLRSFEVARLVQPRGAPLRLESSLGVTWEDAAARLEALPRMIFEPDGSFVITGARAGASPPPVVPSAPQRWQVDGHLFEHYFDGKPQLHRLELHGQCPREVFDEFLRCVGWPDTKPVFELVMEGVTLDEANFREWAAATGPK